jgi:hypothetical protein
MFERHLLRGLMALLLAGLLSFSLGAAASTAEEKAGARAAAGEGVKAFNEERYGDALDMFTRAESLVRSPVHQLFIARSHAQLGNLVLARETYRALSREQFPAGSPAAFEQARQTAGEELATLEPRLPYLTLKVTGAPVDKVTVTMDGADVPAPLIGVPRPVDPGDHEFQATGPGVTPVTLKVTIAEAERKTANLDVNFDAEKAAAIAAAADEPEPTLVSTPASSDGSDRAPAADPMGPLRLASYGAFGVGAVGIGLGVIFGLNAKSKANEANSLCDSQGCPDSLYDRIEDLDASARSANTMAVVGFAVGGVGLAAGATLFILSMNSSAEAKNEPGVTPFVGLGSAGLSGRF